MSAELPVYVPKCRWLHSILGGQLEECAVSMHLRVPPESYASARMQPAPYPPNCTFNLQCCLWCVWYTGVGPAPGAHHPDII